jgi:hypothetical protein
MKCANCKKVLTAKMEIEYSAWMTEYFCSPKCATDKYYDYMQSVPVDFENLPESLVVVNGKLEAVERRVAAGTKVLEIACSEIGKE